MSDRFEANGEAFSYYFGLRKVKKYVEDHYAEPITLRIAARVAGLEEKYFSFFFHAKTGICFRDWLVAVRVGKAIELMREEDRSITEIAFAVGFQDLRTFERSVRRCTRQTPRALKRAVRPC